MRKSLGIAGLVACIALMASFQNCANGGLQGAQQPSTTNANAVSGGPTISGASTSATPSAGSTPGSTPSTSASATPTPPPLASADISPVYMNISSIIKLDAPSPNSSSPIASSAPAYFLYANSGAGRVLVTASSITDLLVNEAGSNQTILGYASLTATATASIPIYRCTYVIQSPTTTSNGSIVTNKWMGRECLASYAYGTASTYVLQSKSIVGYVIPMNASTLAIHPVAGGAAPATLPAGYYYTRVGEDYIYSNGADAYCHLPYLGMSGGDTSTGRSFQASFEPTQMRDDGQCP